MNWVPIDKANQKLRKKLKSSRWAFIGGRLCSDVDQKYSTENQLDTIRRYADQRGYAIVRTFEDSGRSGLRMDGRDGLKSLILPFGLGSAISGIKLCLSKLRTPA